ncbi:hypothetical protein [Aliikangiella maris]|uniref:Uncharacterized protein n=2 Tax=Aliikangiella maris TaxID=3162458 RepID=A0ABV2C019_9GAMM
MDMNTFYDLNEKVIGIFRAGVAWSRPERKRLGSYDEHVEQGFIYNINDEKIAVFKNGTVTDLKNNVLGEYKNNKIYINGEVVGRYIANDFAAAASIALLYGAK